MINSIIDLSAVENPDTDSIVQKKEIEISVSEYEISASQSVPVPSGATIKLNYTSNNIVIFDDDDPSTPGDVYYTPIYTEKLNYEVWKTKINKTFEELEID